MSGTPFSEADVLRLAERAYQDGRARFDPEPADCALLVIDMQDEFVRPGWTPFWVPAATRQVPLLSRLIACCRSRAVPVIHTVFSRTHKYLDRPSTGAAMPNRYCEMAFQDSDLFTQARICPELRPADDDMVIHKPSYGAFFDTPLETILKNLRRGTVLISGTLTNLCCGITARQAYERGFHVVFGSDVNATNDAAVQEAELRTLRYGIARVMPTAEIMGHIAPDLDAYASPSELVSKID